MNISFEGFTRNEVLKQLWENTNFQGFNKNIGLILDCQIHDSELDDQFNKNLYVDYFKGKPIKTNFSTFPILNSHLYDRDAGENMMNQVKEYLINQNSD